MSYGINIKNNAGEWLINENFSCPHFFGKMSFGSVSLTTYPGSQPAAHAQASITLHSSAVDVLVFCTLPSVSTDTWYVTDPAAMYNASSTTLTYSVDVLYPSGGGYTMPELYVFTVDNHKTPSGSFGLQVRNSASTVTFDSRNLPLGMRGTVSGMAFGTAQNDYTGFTFPTKPAFLIPTFYLYRQSTASIREYVSGVRRNSGTISTKRVLSYQETPGDKNIPDEIYGASSGLIMPWIDASVYD